MAEAQIIIEAIRPIRCRSIEVTLTDVTSLRRKKMMRKVDIELSDFCREKEECAKNKVKEVAHRRFEAT